MAFKKVTHCIFDLDGTIVDNGGFQFQVVDEVLQQFGKRYTIELRRRLLGMNRHDSSRIIIEEYDLPISIDEYLQRLDGVGSRINPESVLLPGVEKLIRHLHKNNVPIAIGSSSGLKAIGLKFRNHLDLKSCFHHIVSGSDDPEVLEGKPAPDTFLIAAKRFDPAPLPEQCLVFEDAPSGVRAALAAGMQVVMIPDARLVSEDQRKEPTICLDSLEEFEPEMFGLPPLDE